MDEGYDEILGITDEEAKQELEAEMLSIRHERVESSRVAALTLDDMLSEPYEVRSRGRLFFVVPPPIKRLIRILKLLSGSESLMLSSNLEGAAGFLVDAASLLLWVRSGTEFRRATVLEIESSFGRELTTVIQTALERLGLKADKTGNLIEPDWIALFCRISERFPYYGFVTIGDELTYPQLTGMLKWIGKNPIPLVRALI